MDYKWRRYACTHVSTHTPWECLLDYSWLGHSLGWAWVPLCTAWLPPSHPQHQPPPSLCCSEPAGRGNQDSSGVWGYIFLFKFNITVILFTSSLQNQHHKLLHIKHNSGGQQSLRASHWQREGLIIDKFMPWFTYLFAVLFVGFLLHSLKIGV